MNEAEQEAYADGFVNGSKETSAERDRLKATLEEIKQGPVRGPRPDFPANAMHEEAFAWCAFVADRALSPQEPGTKS